MITWSRPSMPLLLLLAVLSSGKVMAAVPMPPVFNLSADPEEVLRTYPLGQITRQAAFSHHGPANSVLVLPNGKEGWLYDVEKQGLHRTYTLVFDDKNLVIDVLYYDHARFSKYGLSALQVQSVQTRTQEPALGSGPHGQ